MMLFIVQNTHQMGFLGRTLIQKTLFSFYVFLISFNLACPEKPRLWSQSLAHICPNESAGGGMHHAVLKLQDLTFFLAGSCQGACFALQSTQPTRIGRNQSRAKEAKTFSFDGQTKEHELNKQIHKRITLRDRVSQRREDHSGVKSLTVHRTRRQEIGSE